MTKHAVDRLIAEMREISARLERPFMPPAGWMPCARCGDNIWPVSDRGDDGLCRACRLSVPRGETAGEQQARACRNMKQLSKEPEKWEALARVAGKRSEFRLGWTPEEIDEIQQLLENGLV